MNAIQYALNQVRFEIPDKILDLTFSQNRIHANVTPWQQQPANESVDSAIRREVIDARVNVDCNLYGGNQVAINLSTCMQEQMDWHTKIFRIPFESTEGLRLVNVQSLHYLQFHSMGLYAPTINQSSMMLSAMRDLYKAVANMPIVATANAQIVGDNVVVVRDNLHQISDQMALVGVVENDANMNNLNPGAYKFYAQLVILATKAHIFNKIDIAQNRGVIYSGFELGRIREAVDEYRDANQMYREYFNEFWGKVSFTNDRPRMHSFVKSMLSRGH